MNTISFWQPWADAILYLGKWVENRDWYTRIRGTVLVHAAKRFDYEGYLQISSWIKQGLIQVPKSHEWPGPENFKKGGIVGTIDIVSITDENFGSIWRSNTRFAWLLKNPKPIDFYPLKGKPGFFDVQFPFEKAIGENGPLFT